MDKEINNISNIICKFKVMSTVRFSQVTFATKSWVAEVWEKMVVELFSGCVVAEVKQLDEVCESKWEVELKKLQNEVHSLCHHAIPTIAPDSRLLSTGITG